VDDVPSSAGAASSGEHASIHATAAPIRRLLILVRGL
jgi:hypothetical protein